MKEMHRILHKFTMVPSPSLGVRKEYLRLVKMKGIQRATVLISLLHAEYSTLQLASATLAFDDHPAGFIEHEAMKVSQNKNHNKNTTQSLNFSPRHTDFNLSWFFSITSSFLITCFLPLFLQTKLYKELYPP